jgi:hypothetical protein
MTIVLSLVVLVGFTLLSEMIQTSSVTGPVAETTQLPAVTQAAGVMFNLTGREPVAPLELKTTSGADYYVNRHPPDDLLFGPRLTPGTGHWQARTSP